VSKKFIRVNLNDGIKFYPSQDAKDQYKKYYQDLFDKLDIRKVKEFDLDPDENGYVELQLHEFCNIFGEKLYMGSSFVINTNVLIEAEIGEEENV